jgi:hypothetical protein
MRPGCWAEKGTSMSHYEYLSAAEENAMDPGVSEEMNDRARAAMIEMCNTADGNYVRTGWLEFCDECRTCTAEEFIDGLRAVGQEWWEEAVREQWNELYEATE